MRLSTPCPEREVLEQLLLGLLPDATAEPLEQHLLECRSCARAVQAVQTEDTLIAAMRGQTAACDRPERELVEELISRLMSRDGPSLASATFVAPGDLAPTPRPVSEAKQELYDFLAPPQEPGEIGRLGPYRVLKVLGAGGMGVVFQARDPQLERRVALKVMRPGLVTSASARCRFLREARASAGIEHDHIVTVLQVGEDRGIPYLAMPLLQGETLEARLRREVRLAPAEVLRLGREIGLGLAAAHARGLIHRDIKPDNIWLEPVAVEGAPSNRRSRVKILDFGLARVFGAEAHLTHSGTVVGTPAYMAPEQAQGEAVDPRADLFSLGCVLYRACTGEVAFKGDNAMTILRALELERPKPPRILNPAVGPAFSELILKLLAKRPAARYPSAGAVVEALDAIAGGRAGVIRLSRRRLHTALAAAVVLAVLGAAGFLLGPSLVHRGSDQVPSLDEAAAPGAGARAGRNQPGLFRPCHFAPARNYAVGKKAYCVAAGDFNGDSKPDLAVTYGDSVAMFLNNGDGTFRRVGDLMAGSNPWGVVVGDFNGDGILDLAVTREKAHCVSVYQGRGDGTLQAPRDYATGPRPQGLACGDFDGDGKLDLAVATQSGMSVLLGDGDGTFRPAVQVPGPKGAISVAVADFNGDGKSDLVISSGDSDTVRVLMGDGDGTFRPGVPYAVGSGPGVIVVADFNGDGVADLAVENVGSNNVSVLLGNGDGSFRPAVSYPAGASPGGLAVADFNGDGKADLVVANHNSSNVSVLLGNGDGTFRPALHYAAGWTPAGVAVGDFDGDGRPDVVVANYQDGDLSVLLNRRPVPHFRLGTKFDVRAGDGVAVAATAVDADGNPDTHYTGTVRLACTDGKAVISHNGPTLKPEDNGVWSFGVNLKTAGTHTLTVSERQDESRLGTITILVKARPATHLSISAPAASKAGEAIRVTLIARDAFENHDADYLGTVRVTSSDPKAMLPRDYKFVETDNGGRWLPVTLRTPGAQTITVTDVVTGTISGEAKVNVAP
jgi:hypothetical protein